MAETREVRAREFIKLSRHSSIWVGEDGHYYQVFDKPPPGDYPRVSEACRSLCGRPLRRLHWTCLFCRLRRVAVGELPDTFPVEIYLLTKRRGRRFEWTRNMILRRVLNVAEWLAS
jgi:hypothetical protein